MKIRRKLVVALGASSIAAPLRILAIERANVQRVAIFEPTTADMFRVRENVFVEALRELGWVAGRNIVFDRVYGDNDYQRLPALAAALVARSPDVIFTTSAGSSNSAVAATRTIPIVLGSQSELIERGWVQSFAHPGGNVTGIVNMGADLGPKRLQLLTQVLPKATRIGLLVNPAVRPGAKELRLVEQAASALRVTVVPAPAKQQVVELDAALASLSTRRIDALLITHNSFFFAEHKRITDFAAKQRVPVVAHRSELTDAGALMSYSSNLNDQIRRAAQLVDRILKGAKPADIPVEQPTTFEFVVNQRAARFLGITIPNSILLQATRIIN